MKHVYVNGAFTQKKDAKVSVFDRGFLFADAVYEVTSVIDGKMIDFQRHIERLQRSLSELQIDYLVDTNELLAIHKELININELSEGIIYIQISRGDGERDFLINGEAQPTVVLFTQEKKIVREFPANYRYAVITLEDQRWGRCDIKTVQLLYQSLAKTIAVNQGADDAWMTRDGFVTEGTSNNAFIVLGGQTIVTRHLGNDILPGITRRSVLECADELDLTVEERVFSVSEIAEATEAFSTSASTLVNPVTMVNSEPIGDGKPGRIALKLYDIYLENSLENAV